MYRFKRSLVFFMVLFLGLGCGFSLNAQCAKVENLDTSECFDTVQEAIDDTDTDAGDTIKVHANYTSVGHVNIWKSIILEGDSKWSSRVEYGSPNGVIEVTADDVVIRDLGIFWKGTFTAYYYGIKIDSDDCLVDNVIVGDCPRNIYIYGGSGNTISNSFISTVFHNHEAVTVAGNYNVVCGNMIISSGDTIGFGVVLIGSNTNYNQVIGNDIRNHEYGIYVFSANNNDIYYNNFVNNDTHAFTFLTAANYNNWDDGGTYGGNYWGACTDSNCDGFCDSVYTIATGEVDNYPLANLSTRKCQ